MAEPTKSKRQQGYANHPAVHQRNLLRQRQSHVTRLLAKLRKFLRYVQAGRMSQESYDIRAERINKEIAYTRGELPRGAVNYSQKS